jgi:hypothetical protein
MIEMINDQLNQSRLATSVSLKMLVGFSLYFGELRA